MTEVSHVSAADRLRAAWLSIEGDDAMARAQRMGLEVAAANNPELMTAVADLKTPVQAELDLHLNGEVLTSHETEAGPFGRLINRAAVAVKELSKSISGKERMPLTLRVLAPAQGSVRLVFRAPIPATSQDTLPGSATDTLDTLALHRLASILSHTNELSDESPLLAEIQELRGGARAAVQRVAKAVVEGGWDVDGYFRQRGRPQEHVRFTQSDARRLIAVTNEAVTEQQTIVLQGEIDGQRRSLGAMWFVPVTGKTFEAVVSDQELMTRVAELAADPGRAVRCRFNVFISYPTGDAKGARRSYALSAIEDVAEAMTLPLDAPTPGES